ncbi:MAG: AtpZ/AtpI family protein [Candidatus Brocadiaceae bacterium]|nr:AtpZ/AtpI family protein [Candidatus Brocadiaceae bacterium]
MLFLKKDNDAYRVLGLVGCYGFTAAAAMAGGFFLGNYIDRKLDTSPWFLLLFILWGGIGSLVKFFQVIKKLSDENERK